MRSSKLAGKKVLITAGQTQEAIDPVRYISNHASGKMGVAIAEQLAARGATGHLVLGPPAIKPHPPAIPVSPGLSAEEMYEQSARLFAGADVAVMAAAVADYTPAIKAA